MDGDRAEQLRRQIAQCKRLMETVWDEEALHVIWDALAAYEAELEELVDSGDR